MVQYSEHQRNKGSNKTKMNEQGSTADNTFSSPDGTLTVRGAAEGIAWGFLFLKKWQECWIQSCGLCFDLYSSNIWRGINQTQRSQGSRKGGQILQIHFLHIFNRIERQTPPPELQSMFFRVKDSYAAWSLGCSHSKEKLCLWVTTKNFHNKESQTQWLCKLVRCPHSRAQSDECLLAALSLISRVHFYATGRSALKTRRVWIRSSKYARSPNRQFISSWTYLVQFYL